MTIDRQVYTGGDFIVNGVCIIYPGEIVGLPTKDLCKLGFTEEVARGGEGGGYASIRAWV